MSTQSDDQFQLPIQNDDIKEVVSYLRMLRATGLIPSDVVRKGYTYTEAYLLDTASHLSYLTRLKMEAKIMQEATEQAGLSAAARRQK